MRKIVPPAGQYEEMPMPGGARLSRKQHITGRKEKANSSLQLKVAAAQEGEDAMLSGLALLFCFIMFFRILANWADHPEVSSSWLIAELTCIVAVVVGLELCIHVIV